MKDKKIKKVWLEDVEWKSNGRKVWRMNCVDERQDWPDLSWSCERRPREPDTGSPSWCSPSYPHQTLLYETKKNTVEGFREGWSKKHKRVTVKSWYKTIKIMLIQHQKYCYSNMLCGVYVDICNSRAKNGLVFTICRKDVQMFIMQPLQNNNAACSKWAYVITTAHTVFTCTTGSTLATDRKSISGFLWLERGAAEFLTNRLITNRLP